MTTTTTSAASLYPIVTDLTEIEYGCCCGGGGQDGPPVELTLKDLSQQLSVRSRSAPADERSRRNNTFSLAKTVMRPRSLPRGRSEGSDSHTACSDPDEQVKFDEVYVLTRQIFRCNASAVWECVHRESGQRYCAKIIDMYSPENCRNQAAVRREIAFLQAAQGHESIVPVYAVIEESQHIYIVMKLLTGGNLLSRVVQQEGLPEATVKKIARQLLQGLHHLHQRGICHNDLHPSNVLLDADDNVVIADFGSAVNQADADSVKVGNVAAYTAPEVLQGKASYNSQADMWSAGVVLYFCLLGHPPFQDPDDSSSNRNLRSRIQKGEYSFHIKEWNHVSRHAKQLISGLIHTDPTVRLTAEEALQHPWLQQKPTASQTSEQQQRMLIQRPVWRRLASKLGCRGHGRSRSEDLSSQATTESSVSPNSYSMYPVKCKSFPPN